MLRFRASQEKGESKREKIDWESYSASKILLNPSGWLNADIINSTLQNWQATFQNLCRWFSVSSEAWATFQKRVEQKEETLVKKMLRPLTESGLKPYQMDKILIPVNTASEDHWFLAVADFAKRRVLIRDSIIKEQNYYENTENVLEGVEALVETIDKLDRSEPEGAKWWAQNGRASGPRWSLEVVPNVPQQQDSSSCGLWTLLNAASEFLLEEEYTLGSHLGEPAQLRAHRLDLFRRNAAKKIREGYRIHRS